MPTLPDTDARNPLTEECRRCPALVEGRECISWGNGPLDADVVVVGEAPGYGNPDADRWQGGNWTGMAYTSRHSGRRIRGLLADAGFPDCYYTNAVKDKEDVAVPGQAQAQVTAELDETGWTYTQAPLRDGDEPHEHHVEDRSVARDVEIEWFSPIGDGEEREPIREPDEHGMVELKPTDPRPSWPEEDNEWRKELMQEHGDWNDDIPTVDISETEPI